MRLHTTLRARVQPLTNRPDRQPGDHRTLTTQQHRLPTQPPLFTDASIIHTSPFSFFFLLVIYYNNIRTSPGSIPTVTSGGRDGVTAGRKRCVPVLGGPAAVPARLRNRCSGCTRGSGGRGGPVSEGHFFGCQNSAFYLTPFRPTGVSEVGVGSIGSGGLPCVQVAPGCPARAQKDGLAGPSDPPVRACGNQNSAFMSAVLHHPGVSLGRRWPIRAVREGVTTGCF